MIDKENIWVPFYGSMPVKSESYRTAYDCRYCDYDDNEDVYIYEVVDGYEATYFAVKRS